MSLIDTLRGPSKSLRYRFFSNPLNKVKYALAYKGLGRTRLDYWADEMDKVQLSRINDPLGDSHAEFSQAQFEYLKAQGLSPGFTFLDYGCGPVRGGLRIIPFLSDGLYVGADISRVFMQRGVRVLEQAGIRRERFHLVTIRDFDVSDLCGFEFDMGVSFSALQYVSNENLSRAVRGLAPRMKGPFLFDFPAPNKQGELSMKGQYYRTPEVVRQICEAAGFEVDIIPGYTEALVARLTKGKLEM